MQDTMDIKRHVGIVELFRNVFRLYRINFGIFWRVLIPVIILSILVDTVILLCFYRFFPETSWVVGTTGGVSVTHEFATEGTWNSSITYSSLIQLLLWFTIFPLILCTSRLYRGMDVNSKGIWKETVGRIKPILGAHLCILVALSIIGIGIFFLFQLLGDKFFPILPMTIILVSMCFIINFMVDWSLFPQGIMIEDLSAIKSFQRSNQLVHGRWFGFFIRYLLLVWGSAVIISIMFSLIFLILTTVETQFMQVREILLSGHILTILTGVNVKIALLEAPNYWIVWVLLIIKTVVYGIFTPVWAILTTHLYFQQAGRDS